MSIATLQPGFPVILNLQGNGLNNGQVFIGYAGQDPESYPQPVFWDAAGLISAAQPLSTIGGYIARSGTPSSVYLTSDYSMRVKARDGTLVFYSSYAGVAVAGSSTAAGNPNDVLVFRQGGNLVNGEVHLIMPMVRAVTFGIDFAGSIGSLQGARPTGDYTVTMNKNNVSIGSVKISTSGIFTFSSSGLPVTFALNDVLTATGGPADAALSDWGFQLKGARA